MSFPGSHSTSPEGPFPSLLVRSRGFEARGSFAEIQASHLQPDPEAVALLGQRLRERNAGIVAHFYMDPELQGVLYAVDWPHVHISDSLLMADRALEMVESGVSEIVVLGVDFMSENVRAVLDAAGHAETPVYRVAAEAIGCSLAESAESRAYAAYLEEARASSSALHVVYINTSLRTKAHAHHRVPTITCTSSNVIRTVLQASAEVPDLQVWFGPDTYMGANLAAMFATYAALPEREIRKLHPDHDAASLRRVCDQFHYFRQGNCIVHHMFGAAVAETVSAHYADAFLTAHLEVPGEMFEAALAAQRAGRGVVGSTADILRFITERVDSARGDERLRFVLGTEAGMVTSIVRRVSELLSRPPHQDVEVEIVFPVAAEASTVTGEAGLPVVPGVAGGEGCTVAGGCATCPYMKMNDLDALLAVLGEPDAAALRRFEPASYDETIDGRTIAELGGEPIIHMRKFQATGRMPESLLAELRGDTGRR